MKLNILVFLANESNIGDMLNELGEYATDVDVELSKKSIEAMG
jgi:AP-4 complex subunit beta-1